MYKLPGGIRIPLFNLGGNPGGGPGGKVGGRPGGGPGGNLIPPGPIIIGGGLNIKGGGTPIGGAVNNIIVMKKTSECSYTVQCFKAN